MLHLKKTVYHKTISIYCNSNVTQLLRGPFTYKLIKATADIFISESELQYVCPPTTLPLIIYYNLEAGSISRP